MRVPARGDVAVLDGHNADWFADWLSLGLENYLFEGMRRFAFPGAETFIEQSSGTLANDLALIGSALSPTTRAEFRRGVIAALRTVDFSRDRDVAIAIHLVRLGAALSAKGLARTLAEKVHTIAQTDEGQRLFDLAFDVDDQRAALEPEDVVIGLRHMARRHAMFKPAMAGRALIAMTTAQPDAFPQHFDFLADQLERAYGREESVHAPDAIRLRQARRLVRNVAAKLLDETLLAYACRPDDGPRPEERNWWLEALAAEKPELLFSLQPADADASIYHPLDDREFVPILLDMSAAEPAQAYSNAIYALGSVHDLDIEELEDMAA